MPANRTDAATTNAGKPTARRRAGRPGGIREARELAMLVSALGEQGDVVTASAVAARLGCDVSHAKHLLSLLVDAADDEGLNRLPLAPDDDFDEAVVTFRPAAPAPLRLNQSETAALLSALAAAGLALDDPLAAKVVRALAAKPGEKDAEADIEPPQDASVASAASATLRTCGNAIAADLDLAFMYTDAQGKSSARGVRPAAVNHEDGLWYLDAYDLDRRGQRSFRVDRMSAVRELEREVHAPAATPAPRDAAGDAVEFVLLDPSLLEVIHWKNAEVTQVADSSWRVRMPYFGGTWLLARLAACGNRVQIADEALRAQVRAYASDQLDSFRSR